MKNVLVVLICLLLTGCAIVAIQKAKSTPAAAALGLLPDPQTITNQQEVTDSVVSEPGNTPTETITSTPTIEYQATTNAAEATTGAAQATSMSAIQTASAALAQQIQATNDHEARQFALAQMTQIADGATQTAAPTSIPMTATQQAIDNELAAKEAANAAAALNATIIAPTQIVAIAKAESDVKMAPIASFAQAVSPLCIGASILLIGGLVLVMLNKWSISDNAQSGPEYDVNEMENVPVQPKAPVRLYEKDSGSNTINRDTEPPGDPEKFRALIRHAGIGNPLGQNSVVFVAKIYSSYVEYFPVLEWMERHQYIDAAKNGAKVLSESGEIFCANWEAIHPAPLPEMSKNSPPTGYNHNIIPEGESEKTNKGPGQE